jgi:hypothetical protein
MTIPRRLEPELRPDCVDFHALAVKVKLNLRMEKNLLIAKHYLIIVLFNSNITNKWMLIIFIMYMQKIKD